MSSVFMAPICYLLVLSLTVTTFLPLTSSFHIVSTRTSSSSSSSSSSSISRPILTRRGFTFLFGWGPDPIWSDNKVTSINTICDDPDIVELTIEYDRMDEFTKAGQYVQVQTPNTDPSDPKVSYLAMSCPPDSSSLNFMVKKSDSTSFLFEGGDVKELKVSQPLGNGFGIGENVDGYKFDFPVSHILLLCTGTGIAPIKSLLTSSELSLGKNGRTATMYWGLSNDKYCDKIIKELENDSLNVIPVFSNPMKNERQGYVQNALEEDGIKVPRNTAVFVVGQKGMAEAVKRICEEEGVYGERILSNF